MPAARRYSRWDRRGLTKDLPQIDVELLQQVFVDEIWWEGVGVLNPFNAEFEFRRLDRGGEPFQRAQQGPGRSAL